MLDSRSGQGHVVVSYGTIGQGNWCSEMTSRQKTYVFCLYYSQSKKRFRPRLQHSNSEDIYENWIQWLISEELEEK
jgi:hypothetical protein